MPALRPGRADVEALDAIYCYAVAFQLPIQGVATDPQLTRGVAKVAVVRANDGQEGGLLGVGQGAGGWGPVLLPLPRWVRAVVGVFG